MIFLRRVLTLSLALLGLGLFISVLPGCMSSWGGSTSHAAGLTKQQERWWAANASQAKFVAGKGWQVPGTPGYFDASGRPLSSEADTASSPPPANVAANDRNSAANIWESVTGQKPNTAGATAMG